MYKSLCKVIIHIIYIIKLGGDISYANGFLSVWDFFLNQIAPVAGKVPYFTTLGNHEMDWPGIPECIYPNATDSGGECGVMSTVLIPMPAPVTTYEPWWSYDVGLIHMVGMCSEQNFTIGSPQYLWIENDLKNCNRTLTPWIVFGGHRAMYINSDETGGDDSDGAVMDNLIANIEPLLWKYKVNFAFWGHNHALQRMTAVYNREVIQASTPETVDDTIINTYTNPQATVHVIIGTGGASFDVNYVTPYPAWNEMVMYKYGYARVEAVNASYLTWEWVQGSDGVVYDRASITQDGTPWVLPDTTNGNNSSNNTMLPSYAIALIVIGGIFGVILLLMYFNILKLPYEVGIQKESDSQILLQSTHSHNNL